MRQKYLNLTKISNTHISGVLEAFLSSKYSSGIQLSDATQHMGLRITPCDPRVILRGGRFEVFNPYDTNGLGR